jgi:hypothetical protein
MFTHFFWERAMNLGGGTTGHAATWEAETGSEPTSWGSEEAEIAPWEAGTGGKATSWGWEIVSGMILGLWSFGGPIPVPEAIGDYGDLPRRFLRLGHIAFFGLGLINLAISGHWRRFDLSRPAARRALWLMNLGNLGLPPLLLAAGWQPTLLYLMPAPVACVFSALTLCALGAWRACVAANLGAGEGEG